MNLYSRDETDVWNYISDKTFMFTSIILVCNTSDKLITVSTDKKHVTQCLSAAVQLCDLLRQVDSIVCLMYALNRCMLIGLCYKHVTANALKQCWHSKCSLMRACHTGYDIIMQVTPYGGL
jgi:hypothetical protein